MNVTQRLRRDARLLAGDAEAAALFECLVKHAFDPALDTGFIGRVCGAPRPVRERLAAKIGPLKEYVTVLRMAEAERLVRQTGLPIAKIGRQVGYPVTRTFRRAFNSAHGVSPNVMRQRARAAGDPAAGDSAAGDAAADAAGTAATDGVVDGPGQAEPAPEAGSDTDGREETRGEIEERLGPRALASRIRRRRDIGLLDSRRAGELRLKLRRCYPRLDEVETEPAEQEPSPAQEPYPVLLTPTGDWLEEIAATSAFGEILDLPAAEQRFALLQGLRLGNAAAFHQLFKVCDRVVQYDAERALRLARLGVELVEPHREQMFGEDDQWKALAWVGLGRVQLSAGEHGEADQCLGFALAEVGGEDGLEPWVEIELRRVEGLVAKRLRRYEQAAGALDRAVELGRALGRHHPDRVRSVVSRLELASAMADAEAGLALIRELEELVDSRGEEGPPDALWRGLVFFHGAKAHAAAGRECCAERCLRQGMDDIIADPRCDTDVSLGQMFTFLIHELARLMSKGDRLDSAEELLRHCVERYRWLEIPMFEAAAEAELAAVCALRGRRAEARQLAAAAADFLDDLPALHREAWQVARRLRALTGGGAAAPEDELRELLADLRHDLDLVVWEITGPEARPAAQARREKDGAATRSAVLARAGVESRRRRASAT